MTNGRRTRRTRKRRRTSYRRKHRRHRTPLLLGNRKVVKLIYRDEHVINYDPLNIATCSRFYRINSLFDPDFTGVGGKVFGHDAMSSMYARYQVIGARFSIECMGASEASGNAVRAFIRLSDTANNLPTDRDYFDKQWRNLVMKSVKRDGTMTKLSYNYKPSMVENHGSAQDLSASFGGNPSDTHFIEVGCLPEWDGTDTGDVNFRVTIQFIALCTEPAMPTS